MGGRDEEGLILNVLQTIVGIIQEVHRPHSSMVTCAVGTSRQAVEGVHTCSDTQVYSATLNPMVARTSWYNWLTMLSSARVPSICSSLLHYRTNGYFTRG